MPEDMTRAWLKIKTNEPCLVLSRKTQGLIATHSKRIYPGPRYHLKGSFKVEALPP